jgi:glycosyltransferase involved in cell wall biosynthesis
MKNIWVIIPGFNEARYLTKVLDKTIKFHQNIIFVDDGSSDNTASIASKKIKQVLVHDVNLGKGAALKTGCDYAFSHLKAKAVILMDSDNQHDPQVTKLSPKKLTAKLTGAPKAMKLKPKLPSKSPETN